MFRLAVVMLLTLLPLCAKAAPASVDVGVMVNGIHTIDEHGSFDVELFLWWKSDSPDFQPFSELQILNARRWSTTAVTKKVLPDGKIYWSGFITATINHVWDLTAYPFDQHRLAVALETGRTSKEIVLTPSEPPLMGEFADLGGFKIVQHSLTPSTATYPTTFGLGDHGDTYARLTLNIDIARETGPLIVVSMIGFTVTMLLAILLHLVPSEMLAVRVTMVTSAIFAAVGNSYLIVTSTHPAQGSDLIDRMAVAAFVAILSALLCSIVVERLVAADRKRQALQLNRWSMGGVALFCVVVPAWALTQAIHYHP